MPESAQRGTLPELRKNKSLQNLPLREKRQRRTVSTALVLLGAGDTSGSDRDSLLRALSDVDNRICKSILLSLENVAEVEHS